MVRFRLLWHWRSSDDTVASAMPGGAIQFDEVTYSRAQLRVLDRFSIAINPGEVVALVGRSGAGKTTILKLINRLLLPHSGSVRVEDRDTRDWDPIHLRRRIGNVLQDVGLFPHMSVAENIAVVPRLEGWEPDRTTRRTEELLELVGLPAPLFAT